MNSRSQPADATSQRRIIMAVHDGAEILDITGPMSVFSTANALHAAAGGQTPPYRTELAGESADVPFSTSSGIRMLADVAWSACGEAHTLLVAGGPKAELAPRALVDTVRRCAPLVRRVGSICTGAFILARAGLLDGRRATTHWLSTARLRALYPAIDVQHDALHVKDGAVYTSAGVSAGIDLALALLEEDLGLPMALKVARVMVLYLKRPGGQAQFSTALLAQGSDNGTLAETLQWMRANYHKNLRNDDLAHYASMSTRNFFRVFKRETGMPPARYLENIRLEAAVKRLEETALPLETIARETGFQSGEHFCLAFARHFGVTPKQYRDRFSFGSRRQQDNHES